MEIEDIKVGSEEHKKAAENFFGFEMTDKEYKEICNSLEELIRDELKFSEYFAKKGAEELGLDYKENLDVLIIGGRCALDKVYRIEDEDRLDTLYYEDYTEEEKGNIMGLAFKEYLLSHGILPEHKIDGTLLGMLEYEEAFKEELEFYDIVEEDGKIKKWDMEKHDVDDVIRVAKENIKKQRS